MVRQIAALKNDDLGVFRVIYQQYHAKLFHYIHSRTQSEYLAQEVVQITFIRLWEKRNSLSDDFAVDIQLFRIAKTVMIDELRKEQVRTKHNELSNRYVGDSYDDFQIENKDDLKRVFAEMENLPLTRKKAFKLSREQGLSYKQIAEIMSISPKTVENHISRAIKQLRNSISVFLITSLITAHIFDYCEGQRCMNKQIDNIKLKKS
ncbi:MAG TPA: sigma-70 family RNA polymerase sigma factor [Mucilaginibacter sp.]